jgi:hypothetical protein
VWSPRSTALGKPVRWGAAKEASSVAFGGPREEAADFGSYLDTSLTSPENAERTSPAASQSHGARDRNGRWLPCLTRYPSIDNRPDNNHFAKRTHLHDARAGSLRPSPSVIEKDPPDPPSPRQRHRARHNPADPTTTRQDPTNLAESHRRTLRESSGRHLRRGRPQRRPKAGGLKVVVLGTRCPAPRGLRHLNVRQSPARNGRSIMSGSKAI